MGEGEGSTLEFRPTVETLPNGLRLVHDVVPHRKRAAITLDLLRGSRDAKAGVLHLDEHWITCGSEDHATRRAIDDAAHGLRGEFEAETDHETTRFRIKLASEHVIEGARLLHSVVAKPRFRARDFHAQKDVIMEELSQTHDNPPDWITDFRPTVAWGNRHPMGRPIAGTMDTLSALTRDDAMNAYLRNFKANAMVVTISSSSVADLDGVREIFACVPKGKLNERTAPNWNEGIPLLPDTRPGNTGAYWSIILPGIRLTDPHHDAFRAMTEILEDRVSAIVRESEGKTYDICTVLHSHSDCGMVEIRSSHVGKKGPVRSAKIERAIEAAIQEIRRLAQGGPSEAELRAFKNGDQGEFEEDDDARNTRNIFFADQMVYRNLPHLPEETIRRLQNISIDEVKHQAKRLERNLPQLRMLTVTPKAFGDELLQAAKRSVKETRDHGVDELVA